MRTLTPCSVLREMSAREIADAKRLYFEHGSHPPIKLKIIQREMRKLGWELFDRFELTGNFNKGWVGLIDEFGWKREREKSLIGDQKQRLVELGFRNWLDRRFPEWEWNRRYQGLIQRRLMKLTRGQFRRLMIFLPPRHGKSEMVTVRFSAWRLDADPRLRIIIGSYNQKLANRFSRQIRRIHRYLSQVEPQPITNANGRSINATDEWETNAGGGVKAVGVGAGVTGFGADLVIIDDPVKSRADAESQANRERVWEWFNDDIYTRLEPKASIILIQTRWHEDDLAGRLIKQGESGGEKWHIVSLPALAEVGDELGRRPGTALWPRRFDAEYLEKIKRQQGSYSFAALYQQRPMPLAGGLFKRIWFDRIVSRTPAGLRWARGYDLAVSTKTTADYTASFRCAFDSENNLYIADGFRARMEYPDQRRYVIERMTLERNTMHGIEKALHGEALVQDIRRDPQARGARLVGVRADRDKVTRCLSWQSLAEDGKVILVEGPWIRDFLDEVCSFPNGAHDDQIDAVSIAVGLLTRGSMRFHRF